MLVSQSCVLHGCTVPLRICHTNSGRFNLFEEFKIVTGLLWCTGCWRLSILWIWQIFWFGHYRFNYFSLVVFVCLKYHVPPHHPRILPFLSSLRCLTDVLLHGAREWQGEVSHRSFCSSFLTDYVNIKSRYFVSYLVNTGSVIRMFYFCKSKFEEGTTVLWLKLEKLLSTGKIEVQVKKLCKKMYLPNK